MEGWVVGCTISFKSNKYQNTQDARSDKHFTFIPGPLSPLQWLESIRSLVVDLLPAARIAPRASPLFIIIDPSQSLPTNCTNTTKQKSVYVESIQLQYISHPPSCIVAKAKPTRTNAHTHSLELHHSIGSANFNSTAHRFSEHPQQPLGTVTLSQMTKLTWSTLTCGLPCFGKFTMSPYHHKTASVFSYSNSYRLSAEFSWTNYVRKKGCQPGRGELETTGRRLSYEALVHQCPAQTFPSPVVTWSNCRCKSIKTRKFLAGPAMESLNTPKNMNICVTAMLLKHWQDIQGIFSNKPIWYWLCCIPSVLGGRIMNKIE